MKTTICWLLALIAVGAVCSLTTYRIAYQVGRMDGMLLSIHQNSGVSSLVTLGALQKLQSGDLPGATRLMEIHCFSSAEVFYHDPADTNTAGLGDDLRRNLVQYRATYRTNRTEWDAAEQKLEVALARAK